MEQLRIYTFKLYLAPDQERRLHEQRFMIADLWNACMARVEAVCAREQRFLSTFELINEITLMRRELPEWQGLPAATAHCVAQRLELAYPPPEERRESGLSEMQRA